ncbi:iron chelate uptake ABC transporter family permease subunit [uncultured Pseudokineococcus sp.]|uniref:FecCD family ABC transporter permease n=1 Tax=uncultured Pseudokineococcus sp. TaxID=1642928 RepID=UPI00262776AC|nr:iron chelate uptake ABC transporter family permease subunit [uncultured Pseudokineococcus sp.]
MTATTGRRPAGPLPHRELGAPDPAADRVGAAREAVRRSRREARRRSAGVRGVLAALVLGLLLVALSVGDFPLSPVEVLGALVGRGEGGAELVVLQLRLPRALAAVVAGACFGVSGAVLQALLRNPLASPDIIGISAGAGAAAVVAILGLGLSGLAVSAAAALGALATALAVAALATRGSLSGYRFVLVGIGAAALLNAVTSFALTRAQATDAAQALVWITGSLNGTDWDAVGPLLLGAGVLLPVSLVASRALSGLGVGDDAAAGLGLRVGRARLLLVVVAVGLAAVATAAAGPVAFVALVAAPIARRLLPGRSALGASALVGALVLSASDLVAQHAPLLPQLPVGVVTGVVGAPYLLWLLVRAGRDGTAG